MHFPPEVQEHVPFFPVPGVSGLGIFIGPGHLSVSLYGHTTATETFILNNYGRHKKLVG